MFGTNKITSFTDLKVWQGGHQLVLGIYKTTQNFPKEELFGLTSQFRRVAVSFTSNIAEGFGRFSFKEKAQFYSIALGSLREIQNQLLVARDLDYMTNENFKQLAEQMVQLSKMTNALVKYTRNRP